ncbi:MAG: GAF domain-containing protein [Ignavibacteria bacterium]|nr:GAF domain-containing protein [Ignavibacteria bacterium]
MKKYDITEDEVIEISDDDTYQFYKEVYENNPTTKKENLKRKKTKYIQVLKQIRALIADETDLIANLANICAALKYGMNGFFWVGFYFVKGGDLVLGPYQGPPACTRIKIPQGVCGACAQKKETIIVPDVDKFPGHIACSSHSKSEIVVPLIEDGKVWGVLDVDSDEYDKFDEVDKKYLEEICGIVAKSP